MNAKERDRVIDSLGMLVRCEEAMGEFYRACGEVWPADRPLWYRLAEEEGVHAVRLELLQERTRADADAARVERIFPAAALATFLDGVWKDRDRVLSGAVTRTVAFALARDLERSLIESQAMRAVVFDDPAWEGYLRTILTETGEHERRIAERIWQETEPGRA